MKILKIQEAAKFFILLVPVFSLSIPHWGSAASIVAVFFISLCLFFGKENWRKNDIFDFIVFFVFSAYVLAILFSQIARNDFSYKAYLEHWRWLLGCFFYLYFRKFSSVMEKKIDYILMAAIFSNCIASFFIMPSHQWGTGRKTIEFIDPIAYGYLNFSLAVMLLISLAFDFKKRDFGIVLFAKLSFVVLGFFISIMTQSRTGWLAFPVVFFVFLFVIYGFKLRWIVFSFVASVLLSVLLYFSSDIVHSRLDTMFNELYSYPWSGGIADETSVGIRITLQRLGFYYFSQSPFFGWGDKGYLVIKDSPYVLGFSSQSQRDIAFDALFHSEWVTQSVRYGLLGFFATSIVFLYPAFAFLKNGILCNKLTAMVFVFLIVNLFASLTYETFDSKLFVVFYSYFIAVGLSAIPNRRLNFSNF
ncbi:O-antigen ligase family protein [Curvibacter sp. CHRR-16]|uniref:O-antigen ligase family protein n=1 Tax=Curvibacter sp. CHRR-16 TaxID=2835872 RepID=UPI001BD967C5|nr:O-antigen ligase family protein [Curvibacter sp. CHRR-16]MBT0569359.1 O-antigen ligase family protein [Curvibacter sp. CHRR-16]